jgi:hypothetical protein
MAYTKTNWLDRSVQYPNRFTRTNDGTYDTLIPAPGTITQSGTPLTATALNNLETQYEQAVALMNSFGLGSGAYDISNTDLNLLDVTGFYKGTNLTNAPSLSNYYFVEQIKWDGNARAQIIIDLGSGNTYTRKQYSGIWSAWVRLARATVDAWTTAALLNAWTNVSGTAAYYKDDFSTVSLRGYITGGTKTSGTILLTLPAGYRPIQDTFIIAGALAGTATSTVLLKIEASTGSVKLAADATTVTNIALDSVTFRAEQ